MKNIIIEMEKLTNFYSGLGQYCFYLGLHLQKKKSREFTPSFLVPKNKKGLFGSSADYLPIQKIYKFWPSFAPKTKIWHATHQDSSFFPSAKNIPYVLTIHDLNFLYKSKSNRWREKRLNRLQKKIDRARAIVTISNFTKTEIENNLKIPEIPIEVIHNGVSLPKINLSVKPAFVPDSKFIFSIGNVLEKKNFLVLIDFLNKLKDNNLYLIIAGPKIGAYAGRIEERARKLKISNRLIMPGAVSEEQKMWLFSNCEAFVFPSVAEGFGIPAVEAMRCGKPVFLSRFASLPEVGGSEAIYFDNFEPDHMVKVFENGMNEFQKDDQKSLSLIEHSRQFNWNNAVEKYLKVYKSCSTS